MQIYVNVYLALICEIYKGKDSQDKFLSDYCFENPILVIYFMSR